MRCRLQIGPYILPSAVVLAPMAGVTDRPFRVLCRRLGAGLAASEMITSDTRLWNTPKSRHRMNHEGEPEPRVVQLAGADPQALADAARANVALGAQIIDLNMGCPAKKVCGRLCGSALLSDEALVARILQAVVKAVDVPVTLKIRTGWDRQNRNAVRIARIAQNAGIAALSVHGRTRECGFVGAVAVAFGLILGGSLSGVLVRPAIIALAAAPLAATVYKGFRDHYDEPYALMPFMAKNIQLHLATGFLLIVGYVIAIVASHSMTHPPFFLR